MPTMPYDIAGGYTQHDFIPGHVDPKYILRQTVLDAWDDHSQAIDRWLDGCGDREAVDQALEKATRLETELHDEGEVCTCRPDGDACPACRVYLKNYHSDELPY